MVNVIKNMEKGNYRRLAVGAGDVFNLLTVVREVEKAVLPSGQKNRQFLCKCECGNEKVVRLIHLVRGRIASCGCLAGQRHGMVNTPLHNTWRAMKNRCSNDGYIDYDRYKGRGITVCKEWGNFPAFAEWAFQNGWADGLQIDRIDNNGNYEPSNCRFVSSKDNVNNRSNTLIVKYKGRSIPLATALEEIGKRENYHNVYERITRGWDHTKAIDTPIRQGNYRRGKNV